jgi:quercetin 2,3-dioxygenase
MTTPNWLDDHEQRAWRGYQDMRARLDARLRADLVRTSGLSDADYAILVFLTEAEEGRLRARELAIGLQWEKSRLSHQISRMEKRGLVERADCPTDARGAFVVLTAKGDTQWMTAGAGILHDEVPTEAFVRNGGRTHGVQLWVNLPAALKFTPPRYQAITGGELTLLSSPDGGALIRLIAGDLDGHAGPGVTHTPITYAHVTLNPGAQVTVPWNPAFNAMAYVLGGRGYVGAERRPLGEHELAVFGSGDSITVGAADAQTEAFANLEILLLGGLPIREPIAHYGPFLMNTRQEVLEAIEDFNAGRMGTIPAIVGA